MASVIVRELQCYQTTSHCVTARGFQGASHIGAKLPVAGYFPSTELEDVSLRLAVASGPFMLEEELAPMELLAAEHG